MPRPVEPSRHGKARDRAGARPRTTRSRAVPVSTAVDRAPTGRSTSPRSLERARRRYRPRRVAVLVVGESPPASGRFFYHADSGLYRAVQDVFAAVYTTPMRQSFLESFRHHGWYLVDLCGGPVDRLDRSARRAAHVAGVPQLARTVACLRPSAIVLVVRRISPQVRQALRRAGWAGTYVELPYPGRWAKARRAFATQFRSFLSRWRDATLQRRASA